MKIKKKHRFYSYFLEEFKIRVKKSGSNNSSTSFPQCLLSRLLGLAAVCYLSVNITFVYPIVPVNPYTISLSTSERKERNITGVRKVSDVRFVVLSAAEKSLVKVDQRPVADLEGAQQAPPPPQKKKQAAPLKSLSIVFYFIPFLYQKA